jgi:cell division inhibitor SepF
MDLLSAGEGTVVCLAGSREEDTGSMADGFFDKVKRAMGIEDEGDPETEGNGNQTFNYPGEEQPQPQPAPAYTTRSGNNDFVSSPRQEIGIGKVVSMQNASATVAAKKQQWKMLITEPKDFDECPRLVKTLRANRPVIINVEQLERDVARKIFDFLSGAIYAIDGKVQKVSDNIFVFAPANVDIMISPVDTRNKSENIYMADAPWRN